MAANAEWRWALVAMVFCVAHVPLCNGESSPSVDVGGCAGGNVEAREAELRVDVKFRAGEPLDAPLQLLPPELRVSVESINPLVTADMRELDRIGASHMARWFRLELDPGTDACNFLSRLRELDAVETAEQVSEHTPDPTASTF